MLLFLLQTPPDDPFIISLLIGVMVVFVGLLVVLIVANEYVGASARPVDARAPDYSGRVCFVRTSVATRKFGLAELEGSQGIVIQIRTPLGVELTKGERAIVVGRSDEDLAYLVERVGPDVEV